MLVTNQQRPEAMLLCSAVSETIQVKVNEKILHCGTRAVKAYSRAGPKWEHLYLAKNFEQTQDRVVPCWWGTACMSHSHKKCNTIKMFLLIAMMIQCRLLHVFQHLKFYRQMQSSLDEPLKLNRLLSTFQRLESSVRIYDSLAEEKASKWDIIGSVLKGQLIPPKLLKGDKGFTSSEKDSHNRKTNGMRSLRRRTMIK